MHDIDSFDPIRHQPWPILPGNYRRDPNACVSYLNGDHNGSFVKILEHREARKAEPEILIIIEEEHPMMRDVTPTLPKIGAP
jgi:hypothetical protein